MESTLWNGPIYYAKFRQNLEQIVHIFARSWKEDSIKVQYYHNFMIDIIHPMKFDFETLFYEVPEHGNWEKCHNFLNFWRREKI